MLSILSPPAELPDAAGLRRWADRVRRHTLDHLDVYLETFADTAAGHGSGVHFAPTVAVARRQVEAMLLHARCRSVALHGNAFWKELRLERLWNSVRFQPAGAPAAADALLLAPVLAIAETGQLCTMTPVKDWPAPLTIAVLGIDQMLPRLADVAVLLKMISRQALARAMPTEVRLIGPAPRPSVLQIILLDHGRSGQLAPARAAQRATRWSWLQRMLGRVSTGVTLPVTGESWLASLASATREERVERWSARA